MILPALASALALFSSADVVAYLRDPVRVFDQSGLASGALSKGELPPLPAHIVGQNGRGFPGVSIKGSTVYLKLTDVETRGLNANCTVLTEAARSSGSFVARTDVGAASRVGSADVHCIPNPN